MGGLNSLLTSFTMQAPPWLFAAVIAGSVGFLLLAIAFMVLRAKARKRARIGVGEDVTTTFIVKVPKDPSDQNESVAKMQELIAIAETFYAAMGGMPPQSGLSAWYKGRTDEIALEIVAQNQIITFYLTVPKFLREFAEQQLSAQYSDAFIEEVEDYNIFAPTGVIVGGYLTLKRPTILPFKTYKEIESDPMNAMTNALAKVAEGDGMAIQYIIRPVHESWRNRGRKVVEQMQKGKSFDEAYSGKGKGGSSWGSAISASVSGNSSQQQQPEPQRQLSQAEQKMMQGIENKITKAGLEVNIRIISSSKTTATAEANLNQALQAFSQFNIYEFGNAFTKAIPRKLNKLIDDFVFRKFDPGYGMVLNTEELASLWHLPGPTTDTPNINWLEARTAPAPPGLPTSGLHIGYNEFRGRRTEIYMMDEDRRRHTYIIGKTGSGKSVFISYMAAQDIKAGKGIAIIDPHGDLADTVLGLVPKERIDDVIYFNPSDMERPMGLNMLEAPNENMRDFAVQEMISVFYMLFPPEMIGPMFEHNMRNYMLTLMADIENPGTLAEIPRMVADAAFQKQWLDKVTDPVVRSFWEDEMANTSDNTKSEMMGYLTSKVGRFVENEMMRNIIGQAKSSFDFRKIMDEGKILLVNLSKGKTGDVNANLLGLILVSKLQMAAFARADMAEADRKDFVLYIDEFQNFITPSIATILSEARKYRLSLVLAHQYMGQLVQNGKTEIRDAVLGNVGNYLVARVGPEDTEVLGKVYEPIFTPYDLMNTDKFTWNAKLIKGNAQLKPFTLKAVPAPEPNVELANSLKEISRLKYGRPKEIVAQEIALRSGFGAKKTAPPPAF